MKSATWQCGETPTATMFVCLTRRHCTVEGHYSHRTVVFTLGRDFRMIIAARLATPAVPPAHENCNYLDSSPSHLLSPVWPCGRHRGRRHPHRSATAFSLLTSSSLPPRCCDTCSSTVRRPTTPDRVPYPQTQIVVVAIQVASPTQSSSVPLREVPTLRTELRRNSSI